MNELVHKGVAETTEGFEIFPLEVETVAEVPAVVETDKPKRGRPQGSKNKAAPKVKRGPGRPRVYNGTARRIVAAALKKYGLTKGREFLAKERKLKVSITLCRQVAEEAGLEFQRGRPAAA